MRNKEIIFIVEESLDGGFEARAVGYSILTEAESALELKENVVEAVRCHFDEKDMPSLIHLRFQKEEVIAL